MVRDIVTIHAVWSNLLTCFCRDAYRVSEWSEIYRKFPHCLIKLLLTCSRCGTYRRGQKFVGEVKNIVQCYTVSCNGHWPDSVWLLVHLVKTIGKFYGVFPLQHLQTQRKIFPIGQRYSKISHCVIKLPGLSRPVSVLTQIEQEMCQCDQRCKFHTVWCHSYWLISIWHFTDPERNNVHVWSEMWSFTLCDVILTDLFPADTSHTQRETMCPCDQSCEVSHCVMSFLPTYFHLTRADPERNVPVW